MEAAQYSFDLLKIFFGSLPLTYYLELIIRIVVLYLYTFLLFRFIGKRINTPLTIMDILIVLSLGATIGYPMIYFEVPISVGIVLITCVILLNYAVETLSQKSRMFEKLIKSTPKLIIKNGKLLKDEVEKQNLTKEEIFLMLRKEKIMYLEEVEQAYLETSGELSIFKNSRKLKRRTKILPVPD